MESTRALFYTVSGLAIFAVASMVHGQPPRTRSFTYDVGGKKWAEVVPPQLGTAEGDLYAIRELSKDGDHRHALSAAGKFVESHGENHALWPDVLIAKAEAQIGLRRFEKAHLTLQSYLSQYGGSTGTADALRLEFVIAETFLSGVKRKAWNLRLFSGKDLALKILDEITTDYPDSRMAELALKTKADYEFQQGDHLAAEGDYARLGQLYPRGRYNQLALRRTADSALAAFGGVAYDEAALINARGRYEDFRTQFPGAAAEGQVDQVLDGIEQKRAEKTFLIGAYYERTQHLVSAIYYYESVRADWPGSIAAQKATERLELLGVLEMVPPVEPAGDTRDSEARTP